MDAPQKAVDGFLRSVGLAIDQVETRDTPRGRVYFAVVERKGRPAPDVLTEIVAETVRKFPWPKSMRWGAGNLRWVRPLHHILCLFGAEPVPVAVDRVESGDRTSGHRFHAPGSIRVRDFAEYEEKLRAARVILDAEERKRIIREGAAEAARAEGLELVEDEALLAEVAGLVEWPVPLIGRFDEPFLELPPEVLTTAMRTHQKYFALREPKTGQLANAFVVVANLEATDGGKAIVQGNERVLRARLADAQFLYDQDRRRTLESRVDDLQEILFKDELGPMRAKAERIAKLARQIFLSLCRTDEGYLVYLSSPENAVESGKAKQSAKVAALVERAGRLAKADLTTGMVDEFPELQGIMGRYYALHDGEYPDVADAIRDHYLPQGPDDPCPSTPASIAVAIADKLDTLVAFWAIDKKPTGSRDPYALRRAALGCIRTILENGLRLPLLDLINAAFDPVQSEINMIRTAIKLTGGSAGDGEADTVGALRETGGTPPGVVAADLLAFFADRLKVYLRDRGARHDLIDAVFALRDENGNPPDDLVLIVRRVEALADFLDTEDGVNLLSGYKRATNILKIEEKKDKRAYSGAPDPALLQQPEEKALHAAIGKARKEADAALAAEDFAAAMTAIARLRGPVDAFFDHVTVNAEDKSLRENRLKLLAQIRDALGGVADFSRIEG